MNASVQGASTIHKATRPNQNESFFVSHDRGPDHPDVVAGTPLRGRNQWPAGYARHARRHGRIFPRARRDVRPHPAGLCGGARHARGFLRAVLRERRPRQSAVPALPAAGCRRGQSVRPGAAYRQQLYDRAGPHRRAGPRGAAAVRRMASAADHPRHVPDQSRQHHAALVEQPVPVDAARRAERIRHRPLFDRLFPQPQPSQRRSNACRVASAPTTRRNTSRRFTATWCWPSTAPIISTRKATNPRRPRWYRRPNDERYPRFHDHQAVAAYRRRGPRPRSARAGRCRRHARASTAPLSSIRCW